MAVWNFTYRIYDKDKNLVFSTSTLNVQSLESAQAMWQQERDDFLDYLDFLVDFLFFDQEFADYLLEYYDSIHLLPTLETGTKVDGGTVWSKFERIWSPAEGNAE